MSSNETFLQHILSTSNDELLIKFWQLQLQKGRSDVGEMVASNEMVSKKESLFAE